MKIEVISAHNTYNCSAKGGKYKNINLLHKKLNENNGIVKTNSLSNGNIIGNGVVSSLRALQNRPDLLPKPPFLEVIPNEVYKSLPNGFPMGALVAIALKDINK